MQINQAELVWQDGQPLSQQFGDVYFSRDSGLAETQHVFLQHNGLPQRWRGMQQIFTIAETGFGTGLNFLCAWDSWQQSAADDARLHFVSCEKHPLNPADLETALRIWPSLAPLAAQLCAQYRHLCAGVHRLTFAQGRVVLTLLIGDAGTMLAQLSANVDAWFLDGFAPSRNPEMWQPELFTQMARLSHEDTTFATFTSAGAVRRGLEQAGFRVEKVAGFGRKREMLCGRYQAEEKTHTQQRQAGRSAIVIGGGIAGCASSHALAQRGWQVSLIERHDSVAAEASGNPAGMLYPRLAMQPTIMSRLALSGFLYSMRLIKALDLPAGSFDACGLLQLSFDRREAERNHAIARLGLPADLVRWVEAAEASRIAGRTLNHDALHFPYAGWVKPAGLCRALSAHGGITRRMAKEAIRIEKCHDVWQVLDENGPIDEAPVLIIAGANQSVRFSQTAHLPLQPVRGQITVMPASEASRRLRSVICTDGYVSPAIDGWHCMGATFTPDDSALDIRAGDHAANLAMLQRISPELAAHLNRQHPETGLQGRAALRSATPDYLPLTGELMAAGDLLRAPPRHYSKAPALPWFSGLYINSGHGSKGITQAPLCAELLASAICGEPLPLENDIVAALDPNRFLLRKSGLKHLIRGLA